MPASNTLPITIQMGALSPNVKWIPQQLADAIAARLSLVTAQSFALFVSGSTEPASNVGPWLRNGEEWYVWSNDSGSYVPQSISQASLGYIISSSAPDPTQYQVWIQTEVSGSPLAVKIYYSGSWVDVYAATLATYATVAALNAAIAQEVIDRNAAIAAAVAGATFPSYPAQATVETTPQAIPVDGAAHKVVFETAPLNPAPAPFNIVASRYIAPAAGIYAICCTTQFDNDTGVASSMQALIVVYKNGVDTGLGDGDSTPSPTGSRWFPGFTTLIQLAQNDYLELWVELNDGVNTGSVDLTTTDFGVWRISA